jgi:protein-L-isoaspartate(D-aspartate) O-methyltransferase
MTRDLDSAALLAHARVPDLPLARAWMCVRIGRAAAGPAMDAMAMLPRHAFLPRRWRVAYTELALWTGETWMTPPRTIARVLRALPELAGLRVMEIGTGTGYQTALLAALGAKVTSFETSTACTDEARARLEALSASDVVLRNENAWDAHAARCDAIVVNAAIDAYPTALLRRLDGGRGVIVAPVASSDGSQHLLRIESRDGKSTRVLDLGACLFPPAVPPLRKELP